MYFILSQYLQFSVKCYRVIRNLSLFHLTMQNIVTLSIYLSIYIYRLNILTNLIFMYFSFICLGKMQEEKQ